jgi:molybdopterin biosynthesis enzyme
MGSELVDKQLATDDPDQISELIKKAKSAGAEIILVSGGMSVDPDDKTPEGIRRSGAKVESRMDFHPAWLDVCDGLFERNAGLGAVRLRTS